MSLLHWKASITFSTQAATPKVHDFAIKRKLRLFSVSN
jgi:hypothetical protein